jgi:hypothetical protein
MRNQLENYTKYLVTTFIKFDKLCCPPFFFQEEETLTRFGGMAVQNQLGWDNVLITPLSLPKPFQFIHHHTACNTENVVKRITHQNRLIPPHQLHME